MRSATQIICAFLGISVIVSYHLLPRVAPGAVSDFAAAQIAGAGLALLMFAGLIWLTDKARKHTDQPAPVIALTGISLGALSGLLVALVFPFTLDLSLPLPPEFANDPAAIERAGVYRIERIVAFASIIGGGMYVLLQMLAKTTDRAVIPRTEQILSMVAAFSATFIFGVWLTHEVSGVGRAINTMTGGLIDWIGAGLCETHARVASGCGLGQSGNPRAVASAQLGPRTDISQIAAAMLGLYFFLVALVESRRWRLSFARSVIVIGGVVVAGVVLLELVKAMHSALGNGDLKGNQLLFLFGMAMYATLFSFWITWSRNHSLIEALCDAFGSTDNFRGMVDKRLRPSFEIPPRGKSLDAEVRAIVDQAECNGWLDGLIVSSRQSRPDHLKLARIADRLGLGIQAASPGNVGKTIQQLKAPAARMALPVQPDEQLETIIREFSTLTPDERRERQARLEARICKVITPHNEGTGWLIGPDLVLTNYHVVKEMTGENPTVFGKDVVCGFDYKESQKTVLKGTQFGLHKEHPVVDFSPFSHSDMQNDSDELPNPEELDFALLRLEQKAGELPIGVSPEGGAAEAGAALRGWISMKQALERPDPDTQMIERKLLLYVLQHPYGGPLKEEYGALTAVNKNGTRVRHEVTTERGSSGSPCFNLADFEPFALHHAGGHSRTLNLPYNQAIPIGRIMRLIKTRGKVEPFWTQSPGGSEKPFEKR